MIDKLLNNIDTEIRMVRELRDFAERYNYSQGADKKVFAGMISSLKNRIRILNSAVPNLLGNPTQKLPGQKIQESRFSKVSPADSPGATVNHADRRAFMDELNISESLIKKLKKKTKEKPKKKGTYAKPSFYGKASNKFFFGLSNTWVKRGHFKKLSLDLRRSNMNILTTTYISMILFSTFLSAIIGIFVVVFLMFFTFGLAFPYIALYDGSLLERTIKVFWIVFALPLLAFVSFYFFPGAERRSLEGKIDQELPFVVIHMGSISGSGIEPIEIFKIIGLGQEYKYTKKEMMKIINQTNLYGYDLTTALRNVARATPSRRLSELLNGISITINSGGDIKRFFEKRAESLLLEYRLEREKYTKNAETFMDIYISIVIAAPMILLMLLIMIAVSGIGTGFTINELSFGVIGIVGILNIIFLTFLQLKQPSY